MIFDTEKQRKIILELLDSITIPGKALDILYEFKQQVCKAEILKDKQDPKNPG